MPSNQNDQSSKPKRKLIVKKKVQEELQNQLHMENKGQSFTSRLRNMAHSKRESSRNEEMGKTNRSFSHKSMDSYKNQHTAINESREIAEEEDVDEVEALIGKVEQEVSGPQLKLDKQYLCFTAKVGEIAQDSILVCNNGSTAVYYEWRKIQNENKFSMAISDKEQRFLCHHDKNVLKPGEIKKFFFSFLSTIPGVFSENWILYSEPKTVQQLDPIQLTGNSLIEDEHYVWRNELEQLLHVKQRNTKIREIISDIIEDVKTPTPPLPDLTNPEICQREFEQKNEKYHLWYTSTVIVWFRDLELLLYDYLRLNPNEQYWDMNVDYFKELISQVSNEFAKNNFERRFNEYFEFAKRKPVARSHMYIYIKEMLVSVFNHVPDIANPIREELNLPDYTFQDIPYGITTEQLEQIKEEQLKIKNEQLKKMKKKPKNEEEEKKLMNEYKEKLIVGLQHQLYEKFNDIESREPYLKVLDCIKNKKKLTEEYFDLLSRKKGINEIDLEGKRVVLRLGIECKANVDQVIKQEPVEEKVEVEEVPKNQKNTKEKGQQQQQQQKKMTAKELEKEKERLKQEEEAQLLEEQKEQEIKYRDLTLDDLDEVSYISALENIRYCLDHLSKLTIAVIAVGDQHGVIKTHQSVKFIYEKLKGILEQPCNYYEKCLIEDFEDKIETEAYPDNSLLVLENINFHPGEHVYVNEKGALITSDADQKYNLKFALDNYAPIYIIADKTNFFKNKTSLTKVNTDNVVLGVELKKLVEAVGCGFYQTVSPRIVLFGGQLTPLKSSGLYNIIEHVDKILLYGECAIKWILYKNQQQFKQLFNVSLNQYEKYAFDEIAACLVIIPSPYQQVIKQPCEIITPEDFIYTEEQPGIPQGTPEWAEYIQNNKKYADLVELMSEPQNKKDYQRTLSRVSQQQQQEYQDQQQQCNTEDNEEQQQQVEVVLSEQDIQKEKQRRQEKLRSLQKGYLVEMGTNYQRKTEVQVSDANTIIWFDSLSYLGDKNFNELNNIAGKNIIDRMEKKRSQINQNQQSVQSQDLQTDSLKVVIFGESVERDINLCDLVEVQQPSDYGSVIDGNDDDDQQQQQDQDDQELDEVRSKITNQGNTKIEKKNNIPLISDYFVRDINFALKLLSGDNYESLNIIHENEKKDVEEEDEDFDFLDEI